jgi:hypothetical protein
MTRLMRENAVCALLACAGAATVAWLGLYGFAWSDYELEAQPAFEALTHGHLQRFLALAPAYGGSLVERAPFALLAGLRHAGPLGVYRMVALPGAIATVALAVWLAARMRRRGYGTLARAVVVAVCVANPVTVLAFEVGHPEELVGACLCAAAVVLACEPRVSRRGALTCGLMLGLAIANKQWAVLALGPLLLALPPGRRLQFTAATLLSAGIVEAPLLLATGEDALRNAGGAVATGSSIFQPWQIWWFFGRHAGLVHGALGQVKPGYRTGPAWTGTISHPLVLVSGAAIALGLAPGRLRSRLPAERATLALALILLVRCMLDIWDTSYYFLPAILALLVWEVQRSRRPPVLALALSALIWLAAERLPATADVQAAVFLAWSLPLAAWLTLQLFARAGTRPLSVRPASAGAVAGLVAEAAQPTTVSSLDSPVRISRPPGRTTTRSSMRTPSTSGR